MIKNASDLLKKFIEVEELRVQKLAIAHMPTLGAAYEAILSNGIAMGIDSHYGLPPGLNLRVVSGLIDGLPNQIDCMLVRGEGTQLGLLDQFSYPIDQVICVFEVKKTMTKSDLQDGIDHLADVQKHALARIWERSKHEELDCSHALGLFNAITGREPPVMAELGTAKVKDRVLFLSLAQQLFTPATILFGYDGHKTESGIRAALMDVLKDAVKKKRSSTPELLPSLVSVKDYSMVKCNGQPYIVGEQKGGWPAICSTRSNAAIVLLEIIWTKLSLLCNVTMPFDSTDDNESLVVALLAKGVQRKGVDGWAWTPVAQKETTLALRPATAPLKIALLSKGAVDLIERLSPGDHSLTLNDDLNAYLQSTHKQDLGTTVAELVRTSAFHRAGDKLYLEGAEAFAAKFLDGTGIAGPTLAPLVRWCQQHQPEYTIITLTAPA